MLECYVLIAFLQNHCYPKDIPIRMGIGFCLHETQTTKGRYSEAGYRNGWHLGISQTWISLQISALLIFRLITHLQWSFGVFSVCRLRHQHMRFSKLVVWDFQKCLLVTKFIYSQEAHKIREGILHLRGWFQNIPRHYHFSANIHLEQTGWMRTPR